MVGRHISFGGSLAERASNCGRGRELEGGRLGRPALSVRIHVSAGRVLAGSGLRGADGWQDPRQILSAIRQVVRSVAPNRAVFGVKTVDEVVASSLDTPRLSAQVLALFAATALTLAAVGLYSLVMLAVTAQTKEIGLRVALGAQPGRIVAGVIFVAARPVLVGLGAGAVLAVLALNTKALQSLLFGVRLTDGVTLVSVVATLALVAVMAALVPARRAAAIDPIQALREE